MSQIICWILNKNTKTETMIQATQFPATMILDQHQLFVTSQTLAKC